LTVTEVISNFVEPMSLTIDQRLWPMINFRRKSCDTRSFNWAKIL